jgi:hypothetical protein
VSPSRSTCTTPDVNIVSTTSIVCDMCGGGGSVDDYTCGGGGSVDDYTCGGEGQGSMDGDTSEGGGGGLVDGDACGGEVA